MGGEKIRLGGMALANGVLVHGPTAWACAVRTKDGELRVESDYKGWRAADVEQPLLRGPARVAEIFWLLPQVRSRLPAAKLPFERPAVVAAMLGSALAIRGIRGETRIPTVARELLSTLSSTLPAVLALRGSALAAYHGAEHISIGRYEHGPGAQKEHDRCGSHLVGPLLATMAAGNTLAARAPERMRGTARLAASLGALAASTEIFGWMTRNPETRLARALARPGHELQHRLATEEPTHEQLEVAEAALEACLELEHGSPRPH